MKAYIQTQETRADGTRDTFATIEALHKEHPLWWQERGLQYTATGYGARIPTRHMVQLNGRWRRVYCCIFSNSGTLYIGPRNNKTIVNIEG